MALENESFRCASISENLFQLTSVKSWLAIFECFLDEMQWINRSLEVTSSNRSRWNISLPWMFCECLLICLFYSIRQQIYLQVETIYCDCGVKMLVFLFLFTGICFYFFCVFETKGAFVNDDVESFVQLFRIVKKNKKKASHASSGASCFSNITSTMNFGGGKTDRKTVKTQNIYVWQQNKWFEAKTLYLQLVGWRLVKCKGKQL